jgi:hypothetical protein
MKTVRIVTIVAGVSLLLLLMSCDKIGGALKNVQGKVAGQVLSSSGHGRGYVSVVLVPADGTDSFMETTEEMGNFLFNEIPPGEYTAHVYVSGEKSDEIPSDTPTFKLSPGRTLEQNIILTDAAPAAE